MWKADQWKDYEVIDTSDGEKLERWGSFYLVRPDPQVIWSTPRQDPRWKRFDARYARSSTGGGHWSAHHLPEHWCIRYRELTFQVKPMNFKHTGVFPEQAANWDFIDDQIRRAGRPVSVLNLFAYTGGATLAAAAAGASVCHVDAAKGMVAWARENAAASGLSGAPIRWIIDDCAKFVEREIKRGRRHHGPAVLRARPVRRDLEARKGPFPVPEARLRRAVGRSAVFHHQFLHDRPRAVRSDMPPRQRGNAALRRRDGLG